MTDEPRVAMTDEQAREIEHMRERYRELERERDRLKDGIQLMAQTLGQTADAFESGHESVRASCYRHAACIAEGLLAPR